MDEDCLTLNVWTPGTEPAAGRPVLVWVHGGSFTTGTGSMAWYDGSRLAARGDVVVVSFNYRLGVLGFLHLDDLGGERWAGSGNTGLLDQMAALAWVAENIAGFGGDPARVTVFGESAGAMSIAALLVAPRAERLFRRAVLQSGGGTFVQDRATATALAVRVLDELGLEPGHLERLGEVPVEVLLDAQAKCGGPRGGVGLSFMPVVDGVILPVPPETALADGVAAEIPILVGTNRDEMRLFSLVAADAFAAADDTVVVDKVAAILDIGSEGAPAIVAAYRRRWPELSPTDLHVAVHTDHAFRRPAQRLAALQAQAGAGAWSYWFTWESPLLDGWLGSFHGLEIPFVFDNLAQPNVEHLTGGGGAGLQNLADTVADAWLAFASRGDPGWPSYDPAGDRATMRLDDPPELLVDPDADLRRAWEAIGL